MRSSPVVIRSVSTRYRTLPYDAEDVSLRPERSFGRWGHRPGGRTPLIRDKARREASTLTRWKPKLL